MKIIGLTKNQIEHLVLWGFGILIIEIISFFFAAFAWLVFLLFGLAFFVALVLRMFKKYQGKYEPLWVDLSSGILALVGAFLCYQTRLVVVRILTPIIAVVPHFVYILANKSLGSVGYRKRIH